MILKNMVLEWFMMIFVIKKIRYEGDCMGVFLKNCFL